MLINRGTFRGTKECGKLCRMLAEEAPEHEAFRYTAVAVDGRMGLLEWGYEDSTVLSGTASTPT